MARKIKTKEKKEKKGFWKKNYSLSWSYIKESKKFIWIAVILFAIAIAFGFLNHALFGDYIRKLLEAILRQTEGLNAWQMILFIFENNIKNAFMGLIVGAALGVFPLFALLLNGYVIGYVGYFAVQTNGWIALLDLLPHGIFELPALIIALGLGVKFGGSIFAGRGKLRKEFLRRLDRSLRVFIFIILPLLVIAAIIEGLLIAYL